MHQPVSALLYVQGTKRPNWNWNEMKSAHWPKWIALALKSLKVAEQRLRCHCRCHDHVHIPCPLCFARWPSVGAGGRQRETDTQASTDHVIIACGFVYISRLLVVLVQTGHRTGSVGGSPATWVCRRRRLLCVLGGAGNACEICVNILFGFVKCSSLWQTLIASIFWPICQVLS